MISFKDFFNSNKIVYDFVKNEQIPEIIKFFQDEHEFDIIPKNIIKTNILNNTNFKKSIVALSENKIIGCLLVSQDEHRNNRTIREFIMLRVLPKFRNIGVADTLIRKGESGAMNNGIDIIQVKVFEKIKVHDFWKSYGYKLINITSANGYDIFVYNKKM